MAKKTNKNKLEQVVHPHMVAKIVVIAIVSIGVVGSIILVNYFLGTNRADKSRAAAPASITLNSNDQKECSKKNKKEKKKCKKSKKKSKKNKKKDNKKRKDNKKNKKDGDQLAEQDSQADSLTAGNEPSSNSNDNQSPGALVLGPADTSTSGGSGTDSASVPDGQSDTSPTDNTENNNTSDNDVDSADGAGTDNTTGSGETGSGDNNDGASDNTTGGDGAANTGDAGNSTAVEQPSSGTQDTATDQPGSDNGTTNTDTPVVNVPTDGGANSSDDTPNAKKKSKIAPQGDADLQVVKQVDKKQAGTNDDVVFTTIITNNGPDAARDVIVRAAVPADTDYRAYNTTKGVYTADSGVWQVGDLAVGEKVQLAVTANLANLPIGTTISDEASIQTSATSAAATADPNPRDNTDSQQVVVSKTTERPNVKQSVKDLGNNEQEWTLVLSNPDNDVPIKSLFFNGIPNNTFYIAGSLQCVTGGVSIEESCAYDTDKSQIVWSGTLAPDVSGRNVGVAQNAVTITYKTELTSAEQAVANTVCVNWDYNNNASIKDELGDQQSPNCLAPLIYNGDLSGKRDLLVGSLYGLGIGLFVSWLIYLLKKKPGNSDRSAMSRGPKKRLRKKTA